MALTPEGKVKQKVKALLKTHNVWFHFVANNGYGNSGCPDILCCINGKFLAIELKADASKKPTTLQELQMAGIRDNKGCAVVIHKDNTGDLEWIIQHLKGD